MSDLARAVEGDFPPLSVEMVYLRVQTEALIVVLGAKKGARLVAVMEEMFEREQEFMSAHPIRPTAWQTELRRRTQQAAVAFDALRPVFRARVTRR